jgi:phosphate-selective porin
MGQMVPDFSLERQQADYELPLVERSITINGLVPAAATMARDIGVQARLVPQGDHWYAALGLFNGNGANQAGNEDRHFLLVGRATASADLAPHLRASLGASIAYRETDGMDLRGILGGTSLFAGTDLRWGVETRLASSCWDVQAEYLQANLDGRMAWGYYGLAAFHVDGKNQVVVSSERLEVPNPALPAAPWYILGFDHYIDGRWAKLMLDARAQVTDARTEYSAVFQSQVFFH